MTYLLIWHIAISMPFFSKDEIIQRMQEKRKELGNDAVRADTNLALIILGSALFENRLKSGRDYGEHPIHVGVSNTRSNTKRIIGLLHDVVEDSDWTIDDLRKVGFSERVVKGVEAMTHTKAEPYFDAIERCSLNPDAVDKKIEDLSHNMDMSRVEKFVSEKDAERLNKYTVSRAFLVAVKKGKVKPGSSIPEFVRARPDLNASAQTLALFRKYSSRP